MKYHSSYIYRFSRGAVVAVFLMIVLTVFIACSEIAKPERGNADDKTGGDLPVSGGDFYQSLSDSEKSLVEEMAQGGGLRIAIMNDPQSYIVGEDGQIHGFDYHYSALLAQSLGVPVDYTVVHDIHRFFSRGGEFDDAVISDASISYTPDIFEEVDLLASPFAITEWRERLTDMVPIIPVGVVLVGHDASQIVEYRDLDGASMAVRRGDFQVAILQDIEQRYDIHIDYRYHPGEDDVFDLLEEGFADYTIDGSVFLARGMSELANFEVSPLKISLIPVGWAVANGNEQLYSIVRKFISYGLENGSLGEIWSREMGIDFEFYLDLVGNR